MVLLKTLGNLLCASHHIHPQTQYMFPLTSQRVSVFTAMACVKCSCILGQTADMLLVHCKYFCFPLQVKVKEFWGKVICQTFWTSSGLLFLAGEMLGCTWAFVAVSWMPLRGCHCLFPRAILAISERCCVGG